METLELSTENVQIWKAIISKYNLRTKNLDEILKEKKSILMKEIKRLNKNEKILSSLRIEIKLIEKGIETERILKNYFDSSSKFDIYNEKNADEILGEIEKLKQTSSPTNVDITLIELINIHEKEIQTLEENIEFIDDEIKISIETKINELKKLIDFMKQQNIENFAQLKDKYKSITEDSTPNESNGLIYIKDVSIEKTISEYQYLISIADKLILALEEEKNNIPSDDENNSNSNAPNYYTGNEDSDKFGSGVLLQDNDAKIFTQKNSKDRNNNINEFKFDSDERSRLINFDKEEKNKNLPLQIRPYSNQTDLQQNFNINFNLQKNVSSNNLQDFNPDSYKSLNSSRINKNNIKLDLVDNKKNNPGSEKFSESFAAGEIFKNSVLRADVSFLRNLDEENSSICNEDRNLINSMRSFNHKYLENIQYSIKDADGLIDCSEKYFNYVCSFIKIKQIVSENHEMMNYFNSQDYFMEEFITDEAIQNMILKLKEYLQLEGQYKYILKTNIENIEKMFNKKHYGKSLRLINESFNKYRLINIQEIRRLKMQIEESAELLKDKHIILPLGNTGSGKTTTIQFLLGLRMKEHSHNGVLHYEADEECINEFFEKNSHLASKTMLRDCIENLKSSHLMCSETRTINPIVLDEILPLRLRLYSTILCDIPGFHDTNGCEIDIINALLIMNAVYVAKSVRPVIIISSKQIDDRGNNFRKFVKNVTGLFKNIQKQTHKINFIFTKFGVQSHENLYSLFDSIRRQPGEEEYSEFYNIILMRLRNDLILNPINSEKRDSILEQILHTEPIDYPENNFQFFLMEDTKNNLIEQINIHREIIENCLESSSFEIIKLKLEDLEFLASLNICNEAINKFEETKEFIVKYLQDKLKSNSEDFKESLKKYETMSLEKLDGYLKFSEELKQILNINDYFKYHGLSQNSLLDNFEKILKETIDTIKKEEDLQELKLQYLLEHFKNISIRFVCYKDLLSGFNVYLHAKVKDLLESLKKKLFTELKENKYIEKIEHKNFDVNEFVTTIRKVETSIRLFEDYISFDDCSSLIDEIRRNFKDLFTLKVQNAKDNLCIHFNEASTVNEKGKIKTIEYVNNLFEELNRLYVYEEFFIKQQIDYAFDKALEKEILDLSDKQIQVTNINNETNDMMDDFSKYQDCLMKLEYLKKIDQIQIILESKIRNILDKITKFLNQACGQIQIIIQSHLKTDLSKIDKMRILKFLKTMKNNFSWIKNYRQDAYLDFFHKIFEDFLSSLNADVEMIEKNIFSIEISNKEILKKKINSYRRLKIIKDLLDENGEYTRIIDDNILEVMEKFEEETKKMIADLTAIIKDTVIKESSFKLPKLTKYEKCLEFFNEILPLPNLPVFENFEDLRRSLRKNLIEVLTLWKKIAIQNMNEILYKIKNENFWDQNNQDNDDQQVMSLNDKLTQEFVLFGISDKETELINDLSYLIRQFENIQNLEQIKAIFVDEVIKNESLEEFLKGKVYSKLRQINSNFKDKINILINNSLRLKSAFKMLEYFKLLENIYEISIEDLQRIYSKTLDELKRLYYEQSSKQEKDLKLLLQENHYIILKRKVEIFRKNDDSISQNIVITILDSVNTKVKEILREIHPNSCDFLDKSLTDYSKVKSLSNLMIDCEELFKNFEDDIDKKSMENYNTIKKTLKEQIKFQIQRIGSSIEVQRIENFTLAISYYDKVVTLMKRIFDYDISEFNKAIEDIGHIIKQKLIDYENSELSFIAMNKTELLSLKKEILGGELNQFSNYISSIINKIKVKVRKSIETLDNEYHSKNQKRIIDEITSCLEILDPNDRNELDNRLKSVIDQLESNDKKIGTELNDYLSKKNYKKLFELIKKIEERDPNDSKKLSVTRILEEKIGEHLRKIQSFLKENLLKEAISEYEEEVQPLFEDANSDYFYISKKNELNNEFKKYFDNFAQCFESFGIFFNTLLEKIKRGKEDLFENRMNSNKYNLNYDLKLSLLESKKKAEPLKNYMISFSKIDYSSIQNLVEKKEFYEPNSPDSDEFTSQDISFSNKEINNFSDVLAKAEKCFTTIVRKLLTIKNIIETKLRAYNPKLEDLIKSIFYLHIFEDCLKFLIGNSDVIFKRVQIFYNYQNSINCINNYFIERKIIRESSVMAYLGSYDDLKNNLPVDSRIEEDIIQYLQTIQERIICRTIEYEANGIELPYVYEENLKEIFLKIKNNLLQEIMDFNHDSTTLQNIKQIGRISKFLFDMRKYQNSFPLVDLESQIKSLEEDLKLLHKQKIDQINQINRKSIDLLAKKLIDIKIITSNFIYNIDLNNQLNQLLRKISSDFKNHFNEFQNLHSLLVKNTYGNQLVNHSNIFQEIIISIMNERIKTHDQNYVFHNLKIFEDDRVLENNDRYTAINSLKINYEMFNLKYQNLVNNYITQTSDFNTLPQKIIQEFGNIKSELVDSGQFKWDNIKNNIPKLLAYLFCFWSLKFTDWKSESVRKQSLKSIMKPHPGQVIPILRMLGVGQLNISNHLSEIKTGEGKSVVLGILSCFFSLFDFDVHVACYSKYLSDRDFKSFSDIFASLKIIDRIKYGTFNELCEIVINSQYDIREGVKYFLKNNSLKEVQPLNKTSHGHIIFVDEVDVLFSKEFYGSVYSPCAKLSDQCITRLLDRIWIEFKDISKVSTQLFKESSEYIEVIDKYPQFIDLIDNSIATALYDLKNYEDHSYILSNDGRIGYVEQDNIVYNRNQGYKTLFAYYKEFENKKVSEEKLNEMKFLQIKCGNFSYTKILENYKYIFGVTGTLQVVNKEEERIIREEFNIRKKTIVPSVYGDCKLKFDKDRDFQVVSQNDFFMRIVDRIKANLFINGENKRAVLVFFENKKILDDFYNSNYFKEYKQKANILTEQTDKSEKDNIIVYATSSGQVTLLTRMLGRGTDFIIYDNEVINNRGTACIQTFPSESSSEEVQIKGRVARQGQDGSYEVIVIDTDLEKFSVPSSEFKNTKYETLVEKREDYSVMKFKEENKYIGMIEKEHNESMKFRRNLENKRGIQEAICYLQKINFTIKLDDLFLNSSSRTLILMDATGSMHKLIASCKEMLCGTFDRLNEVLINKNVKCIFEIQLAVYRNYNVDENLIFENSEWESNPYNLKFFLDKLSVFGGIHEEAIELGLNHAYKEHVKKPISQVILLGDAPSNSKEQVIEKRKVFSSHNWESSKYKDVLCYKEELKKLKDNNVSVHTFYLHEWAKANFDEISSTTGGKSQFINIHTPDKREFIKSVETILLANIAKNSNINELELLREYDNIFKRSYI